MQDNLFASFPRFTDFLSYSPNKVSMFIKDYFIHTVYLPIDGTRRFFLLKAQGNHLNQALNMNDPRSYFQMTIQETIRIIKLHYDYGIKNVILLLMDDTAFTRPPQYIKALVKYGILPIRDHPSFLKLFKEYNVRVLFGGFNERYAEVGTPEVLTLISEVQEMTKLHSKHNLLFYTGTTPQNDYLRLLQKITPKTTSIGTLTLEDMIKALYGINIPPIAYSLFFNFPRDKILPPLLWGHGVRFYMANPSLSLTKNQVLQAIYYTALSRLLIKDDYINYAQTLSPLLIEKIQEYYNTVQTKLFGTSLYHDAKLFPFFKNSE